MTINEAINALDTGKNNTFSRQEKICWLSRVDSMIQKELVQTHQTDRGDFTGYTDSTDPETLLLVPAPWDELYLHYMQAQIDYANGDMTRYTNGAALYNNCLAAYKNHYNRTNAPKGQAWRYF